MPKVYPRRILIMRCPVCNADMGSSFIGGDRQNDEHTRGLWGEAFDSYQCEKCGCYVDISFELCKPIISINGVEYGKKRELKKSNG